MPRWPCLAGVVALATAGSLFPQSPAASQSGIIIAHRLIMGGGYAVTGAGNQEIGAAGQGVAGPVATSVNYELRSGVSWVIPEITTNEPIIAGVREANGDKDGGETRTVFGFNFLAPGSGPLNVTFDGTPATGVAINSNVRATVTTPVGTNEFGNPLAGVEVGVDNLLGSHAVQRGFLYEPALTEVDLANLDEFHRLRFFTKPGESWLLVLGQLISGFAVPVPPFDGAAEVLLNVQVVQPFAVTATGQALFNVPVPNEPVLIGGSVVFQGFSLAVPPVGSFSNSLTVVIHP
ncbi:MAG: hypothetical protein AAF682_29435 [Planctomycetota bacterium]